MNRLLIVFFSLIASGKALSQDMGIYGKVYPITEENLLVQINHRAKEMVESGEWDTIKENSIKKAKAKVDRPVDWQLPTATVLNERFVDLTVTLGQDIRDQNGRLLYAAGTVVNPMDYIEFNKTLILFDGDDENQTKFVKQYIENNNREFILILVGGSVHEVASTLNQRVYVDQHGQYIERFNVRFVPSIIEVGGQNIKVTETPPHV